MHAPRDRSLRHAEDRPRFRVSKLLACHEDCGVPKRRLQSGDRALQPDCVIEVAAVGGCCNADKYGQLLRKCAEGAAPPPPVPAGVERDPAQPGAELGFSAEAADLLYQRAANVLCDVVGISASAGQLPGETMDTVVMALEERGEGISIAGDRGGDETGIWIATDLCHPLLPTTPTEVRIGLWLKLACHASGLISYPTRERTIVIDVSIATTIKDTKSSEIGFPICCHVMDSERRPRMTRTLRPFGPAWEVGDAFHWRFLGTVRCKSHPLTEVVPFQAGPLLRI